MAGSLACQWLVNTSAWRLLESIGVESQGPREVSGLVAINPSAGRSGERRGREKMGEEEREKERGKNEEGKREEEPSGNRARGIQKGSRESESIRQQPSRPALVIQLQAGQGKKEQENS